MRSLRNTLSSRGLFFTFKRLLRIIRRYGFTDKKMAEVISQMNRDATDYRIGMTVPITLSIISEKRANFFKNISNEYFEIAVHGFKHEDFSILSRLKLEMDLELAGKAITAHELKMNGYRSPYLRSGENLLALLAKDGFRYSSSTAVVFDRKSAKRRELLERMDEIAFSLYGAKRIVERTDVAEISNGIVVLPVSLPDDEIIIDRMGITDNALLEELIEDTITSALRFSTFAVIQIHPERYPIIRNALLSVVSRLKKDGVDFPTINSLTDIISLTGHSNSDGKRYVCISGDLDIMSIWDLLR